MKPDPPRRRMLRVAAGLLSAPMMAHLPADAAPLPFDPPRRPLLRAVPQSGEQLPAVGLGTWQSFDIGAADELAQARDTLRLFTSLGGRMIDSSPMYGRAESVVGDLAHDLGVHPQLFIATKVWTRGREAGIRQMETSFDRLRVQRLDLMQVHNLVDADAHLATLREWKKSGRIRYIGVTHYHAGAHRDLEKRLAAGGIDFVQLNYSLAEQQADRRLLRAAAEARAAVIVNRPFAEGAMFKRVNGRPLPDWAGEIGCSSWAQFFLKWILGHPAVTCAIPGTRNARHIADNLAAAADPLPDDRMRRRMAAYYAGPA